MKEKILLLNEMFFCCDTRERKYQKIIELGKKLFLLDSRYKIKKNLVKGCQSLMYLRSYEKGGEIYFEADSDAIISRGLAYLVLFVYNKETPEDILRFSPKYLDEMQIYSSLSMNRSNGLSQIVLQTKKEALSHLQKKP